MGNDMEPQAQIAFDHYEFGDGVTVEDSGGWEHSSGSAERSRPVFVSVDGQEDTVKLTFVARFTHRNELDEVYAIDSKGQIWGSLPSRHEQARAGEEMLGESRQERERPRS